MKYVRLEGSLHGNLFSFFGMAEDEAVRKKRTSGDVDVI